MQMKIAQNPLEFEMAMIMEEVKTKNSVLLEEAEAVRFKINRKWKVAFRLKSAISDKLRHLLCDFSDDVLAEYITVLVCNGKNQYQARDDLDAFLADRTPAFVCWLWSHLSKYVSQTDEDSSISHLKDTTVTHPGNNNGQDDSRIHIIGDFPNHPNHTLTRDEKIYHLPASASNSVPSCKMEFAQGSRYYPGFMTPLNEVNINVVLSQKNCDKSSRYDHSARRVSTVIPADGEQCIQRMEKPKKTINSKRSLLPNKVLYLPKREPEYPCIRKLFQTNVSRTNHLPESFAAISQQKGKSRVSVWDRLGKPCDNTPEKCKTAKACHVGLSNLDEKVVKQTLLLPVLNAEPSRSTKVPGLENNCGDNNPSKCRSMERETSIANNIGRKRHFGEISHSPATAIVPILGDRNNDLHCKEISREFKKSIMASEDSKTSSNLVSEVLNMKQKLHQIEMEMFKLRSKQVEMKKDVKLDSPLHSSALKQSEKDFESRTVYVTNVHFAATEESLSLYFSRCGVVKKVVISTEKAGVQPRRFASVTFTSKESVDKAVALSGTSFFSRTIKVIKKAETAAVTATPAQHAPNAYQAPLSYLNRKVIPSKPYYHSSHLQWCRGSAVAPSEPSARVNVEGKGINTSTQQELPSCAVTKANSLVKSPVAA